MKTIRKKKSARIPAWDRMLTADQLARKLKCSPQAIKVLFGSYVNEASKLRVPHYYQPVELAIVMRANLREFTATELKLARDRIKELRAISAFYRQSQFHA